VRDFCCLFLSVFFTLFLRINRTTYQSLYISPPNYTVTTPGSILKFDVNGQDSGQPAAPPFVSVDNSFNFSLNAGATYIFDMNTTSGLHPVNITTTTNKSDFYSGASAQSKSGGAIVTLTIPATNYPTNLYYVCNIHTFYGIITVNPPQAPPPLTITKTAVSSNIVLTFSGGTNTIALIPQYNSNLVSGTWQSVPGYTNTFTGNGVSNKINFGRLDAICGPDVFLRVSQAPN
jgi:hypothetical protein